MIWWIRWKLHKWLTGHHCYQGHRKACVVCGKAFNPISFEHCTRGCGHYGQKCGKSPPHVVDEYMHKHYPPCGFNHWCPHFKERFDTSGNLKPEFVPIATKAPPK